MTGPWVIDASVLAKVYLRDEEFAPVAQRFVSRYVDASLDLVAPQLILYEIPSAIQTAVRRGRLDPKDGLAAMDDFFRLQIPVVGDSNTLRPMLESASALAEELGCRLYDAMYLTVAETLDCRFITADLKLYGAVSERADYVVWIADYAEEPERST